jgi:hypothetical protein
MFHHRAVGRLLPSLMLGLARVVAAQSPTDSAKRHESSLTQVWGSVGLGAGNSSYGRVAGRAAASLAVNPVLMFTVAATSVGYIDRVANSTNLLAGVKTPDPNRFLFLSAGWARTTCGNSCEGGTGIAVDGGIHVGGKYAGVAVAGFAVHAPLRTSASGVVVSFDFGWFVH